jgi:hypothetical protein
MEKYIKNMIKQTECLPWYWLSCGEKCYAFSTVEAYPLNENDPMPEPGTQLSMNENGDWIGSNDVKMVIESEIASVEKQNGDTICSFIAAAHAHFMKDYLGI